MGGDSAQVAYSCKSALVQKKRAGAFFLSEAPYMEAFPNSKFAHPAIFIIFYE